MSTELQEHDYDRQSGSDGYVDSKETHQRIEDLEHVKTHATYIEKDELSSLSEEHRQYLLSRHGTLDLDPVPGYGDADPYNWPHWKKVANLVLVAFHACMATFTAAAIVSSFISIAEDLGVSVKRATYITSLQFPILGCAPLFWRPLADRWGRRPVFLLSLICSMAGNIGCAKSQTYSSMAACRAIVAFFISPAAAIGSGVVTEIFFRNQRAKYIGIWTVMITLGVPLSPFIFGFVAYRVNYRWIYWTLAITNAVQFILYVFLGPETRYIRKGGQHHGSTLKQEYLTFARIDPTPLRLFDFVRPITLARFPTVMIPAAAYSMVLVLATVLISLELAGLFGEKFGFNTQQIGLQFLGIIIGCVMGEQIGGWLSDYWMNRRARVIGGRPQPEFRLWLSYPGYLLAIAGLVVFFVQFQNAPVGKWNVTPIVGSAVAAAGNQIVTTVLYTYAVDCHREEAASIGVFINFVRQMWCFLGPFWFPPMFASAGFSGSAGISAGLIAGVSILPTLLLQFRGKALRVRPKTTDIAE